MSLGIHGEWEIIPAGNVSRFVYLLMIAKDNKP